MNCVSYLKEIIVCVFCCCLFCIILMSMRQKKKCILLFRLMEHFSLNKSVQSYKVNYIKLWIKTTSHTLFLENNNSIKHILCLSIRKFVVPCHRENIRHNISHSNVGFYWQRLALLGDVPAECFTALCARSVCGLCVWVTWAGAAVVEGCQSVEKNR